MYPEAQGVIHFCVITLVTNSLGILGAGGGESPKTSPPKKIFHFSGIIFFPTISDIQL